MWTGAPGGKGWAPNIFDAKDASNNTAIDEPRLRGSIMVRKRIIILSFVLRIVD
jgi:hypothetical protein